MLQLSGPNAGYFDWAIRFDLPGLDATLAERGKLISRTPTPVQLMVAHSQEGNVDISLDARRTAESWTSLPAAGRTMVLAALDRAYWAWRDPNRAAYTAWHGTNLRGTAAGVLVQHAPIWARLAHGNSANPYGPGWEAEGFAPTPLDLGQRRVWYRMLADIRPVYGVLTRANRRLREHREVGPTDCPGERYTPLWAELEDEMEPEQLEMIRLVADAMGARPPANSQNADGDRLAKLREFARAGFDFHAQIGNLNDAVIDGFDVLRHRLDALEAGEGRFTVSGTIELTRQEGNQ